MLSEERAGVLIAILGYVAMSCGDALFKLASHDWAVTALAALRYSIGAAGLGAMLWLREGRAGFRVRRPWVQLMRSSGVAIATACFVGSLRIMPLVDATAIVFTSPILTALIAALVLREPVGRTTWIAIVAGFVGVVIVLRPNLVALGPAAILPLISALGMSMLVIGNRLAAHSGSPLAMQFQVAAPAAAMLVAMAVFGHFSDVAMLHVGIPTTLALVVCFVVACTATAAHWALYLGTTRAGASTIAPTTYVQIIVAGLLGWAIFGDMPDLVGMVGVAIIVGAGLVLWRTKKILAVADDAG